MQRRFVLWWCALSLAAPTLAHHARVQRADRSLKGWPIEPFTLTDHHGKPFSQANLRGQWTFVLFGDTRCAEPCTAALSALAGLCKRIERADALKTTQIVFVSVDPEHDTPQRLRDYLAPYGPRFIGSTAPRATLQRFADDLGLAEDEPRTGWPDAQHHYRGSLVLVGRDAVVRAEYLPPFDVLLLTSEYMRVRSRK
jgi:protein SCO1